MSGNHPPVQLLSSRSRLTPERHRRYERSAEGYDAQEKRTELFHPESRFLIVRQGSDPPLGYCIFRFDTEETASEEEGEDDMCDVVYWCVSGTRPFQRGTQTLGSKG